MVENPRRAANGIKIDFCKWKVMRIFWDLDEAPREGLCGAALVEADSDDGGVAGFQEGNAYWAMSP